MNPHEHPKWDQWSAQGLSESEMRAEMLSESANLQADHLNECHPEPHGHPECPICIAQDRVMPY